MCDRHNSVGMPIGAAVIKQETGIKEEPQAEFSLEEFPALDSHGDGRSLIDYSRLNSSVNSANLNTAEVKIEIKEESNGWNKKKSKSKQVNANRELMNHQQVQSNRHGMTARNAGNSSETDSQQSAQKQHQCEQCEYSTKYEHHLKAHLLKHTGQKPFPCNCCAKSFTSKSNLQNHMKVHVNEFLFHCSICLKGFDRKNEKSEHESNCDILRYECHLCKKSFGSMKLDLTKHMCVHSDEKPFECTECSKKFTTKSSLKGHLTIHAGPRSFRCFKCRQGFAVQTEMIEHQQKCSRRMYECYVCGKFIGLNKEHLERHMRTHTGDKPFGCNQCPKKFTQKLYLRDHMVIHSCSLPWKCVICRQGFVKQFQWKEHQRNCTRRIYECHLCKGFFGSRCEDLKRHMLTHSGKKPFQCGICQSRFTEKSHLTRHINTIHNKMC